MILTDVVDCNVTSCNSKERCIEVVGGGFVCQCDYGWGGEHCAEDTIDDCLSEPCQNGGSCTDGEKNYTCDRILPWIGRECMSSKL